MPSAQKPFMVMRCPPLPTVQFTLPHVSQQTEFMKLSCPSQGLMGAKGPQAKPRMTVRKDSSDSCASASSLIYITYLPILHSHSTCWGRSSHKRANRLVLAPSRNSECGWGHTVKYWPVAGSQGLPAIQPYLPSYSVWSHSGYQIQGLHKAQHLIKEYSCKILGFYWVDRKSLVQTIGPEYKKNK